jgi:hypothetical protein
LDAGCGDALVGKGFFDRRIHWRGFIFLSHHSKWSGAVPNPFLRNRLLSHEKDYDFASGG